MGTDHLQFALPGRSTNCQCRSETSIRMLSGVQIAAAVGAGVEIDVAVGLTSLPYIGNAARAAVRWQIIIFGFRT